MTDRGGNPGMGVCGNPEPANRLDWLWNLLFPPKCPFCGRLLAKGEQLCPDCQRELPWLEGEERWRSVEGTEGCLSVFHYQDKVRKSFHGYKFGGLSNRAECFGTLMARYLADGEPEWDGVLITWAPLSGKRLRRRGYDQAELLARRVGLLLKRPVERTLKKNHRPPQSGLTDPGARRANLLGAYSVPDPEQVAGKRILLIDDVVTTGSTLTECAGVLREAGAASVVCGTLARAGGSERRNQNYPDSAAEQGHF